MGPLPELESCFIWGGRAAMTRLSNYLRKEGLDLEQFQALLSLLLEP